MQSNDHYKVLGISRSCSIGDVKEAYRRNALRFHPDALDTEEAKEVFEKSSNAYQILSNPHYRALYDQYGHRGVGLATWIDKNASGEPPYSEEPKFTKVNIKDPKVLFEEFFATSNCFAAGLTGSAQEDLKEERQQQTKVDKIFYSTLEELYNGGVTKTLHFFRKNGRKYEEKIMPVKIQKGWEEDAIVEFKGFGSETESLLPADVVYTLKVCPHPKFCREGNDLHYTCDISLTKALTGCCVHIRTLDERILSIPVVNIVNPNYTQKVIGEGMPIYGEEGKFGDLILHFNVAFPKTVDETLKQKILQLNL